MKRIRPGRWSAQLLAARPSPGPLTAGSFATTKTTHAATACTNLRQPLSQARLQSSLASAEKLPAHYYFPSPPPERALESAKLAALHARLALSEKLPLQTLARTLIDRSADPDFRFNNRNLASLGKQLIEYHVNEWLICRYPRLPYAVMIAARDGYAGDEALENVAKSWGVEMAAAPGGEVDAGLLQFSLANRKPDTNGLDRDRDHVQKILKRNFKLMVKGKPCVEPSEADQLRPLNDKVAIHALAQGEPVSLAPSSPVDKIRVARNAHAAFVQALVGAVYAHCGREAAKLFINAHVLSRQLDIASLFSFKRPTIELARLCAREDFEEPRARLLSETGRHSRTPVFVVGIFSGNDKLGEGAGSNPNDARANAAMNALKAWYLYSPGPDVRVPSDMLVEGAKPWQPAYVDIGEII